MLRCHVRFPVPRNFGRNRTRDASFRNSERNQRDIRSLLAGPLPTCPRSPELLSAALPGYRLSSADLVIIFGTVTEKMPRDFGQL